MISCVATSAPGPDRACGLLDAPAMTLAAIPCLADTWSDALPLPAAGLVAVAGARVSSGQWCTAALPGVGPGELPRTPPLISPVVPLPEQLRPSVPECSATVGLPHEAPAAQPCVSGRLGSMAPIGIFDSGIGGLSVLRALREELPGESFVYLADSAHAPYGERGDDFVCSRSVTIADYLIRQHGIKALVVACNTATAAAVDTLRQRWPHLPLVGVEPAIKPAAQLTRTGRVGVMATRSTVGSRRFQRLLDSFGQGVRFHVQACDGLAHAIEHEAGQPCVGAVLNSAATSAPTPVQPGAVGLLCQQYTQALGTFGTRPGEIDTLVLGCTHYVFARDTLRTLLGTDVQLLDTGSAVARQTRRLLAQAGRLAPCAPAPALLATPVPTAAATWLLTTGELHSLQRAVHRWLGLPAECCAHIVLPLAAPGLPDLALPEQQALRQSV